MNAKRLTTRKPGETSRVVAGVGRNSARTLANCRTVYVADAESWIVIPRLDEGAGDGRCSGGAAFTARQDVELGLENKDRLQDCQTLRQGSFERNDGADGEVAIVRAHGIAGFVGKPRGICELYSKCVEGGLHGGHHGPCFRRWRALIQVSLCWGLNLAALHGIAPTTATKRLRGLCDLVSTRPRSSGAW